MNNIDPPAPREWWGPLPDAICGVCGQAHAEAEHEDSRPRVTGTYTERRTGDTLLVPWPPVWIMAPDAEEEAHDDA